ncbi:MAG: hypothetical protein U0894_05285 [Pirellulales bacterium]
MATNRLRVYYGPDEDILTLESAQQTSARQMVTLPLGDVLPLLADAVREIVGLDDFEGDCVTISSDLYEVLLAYQSILPARCLSDR